tara:strand:- start:934 stop:1410 length:477 start_codon:yes stop_codon:yes gene_type:complete
MGFDVSGLNPKIHKAQEEYSVYGNKEINVFNEDNDEDLKNKYFDQMDQYHEDNPGVYFRNNVWWWRPLWEFTCHSCIDFLTEEDMRGGHFNDGYEIGPKKAYKIGMKLRKLDEEGDVEAWRKKRDAEFEEKDNHYPFDAENVRKFATFCIESGGFCIC